MAHEVAESNLSRLTDSAHDVERSRMGRTRFGEVPIGDWFGFRRDAPKFLTKMLCNSKERKTSILSKTNEGIA